MHAKVKEMSKVARMSSRNTNLTSGDLGIVYLVQLMGRIKIYTYIL